MASHGRGKSLGKQVRDARVAANQTLRGLARDLGLSPSYLNDIEFDRRVPSTEVLRQIADRLVLDVDALLAAAGRVGIAKDAEQYIRETPSAGVLFRRVTTDRLTEDQVQRLIKQVDKMTQDDSSER
ncbi:helix-turn-helix domain-containing protein [Mycobacterium nebraskense]|uniref:helix-turn-helix domain-containing protein n=1 Tax=Mycobacterium nebraskense TaxID=244292 RepID=UPI0023EFF3FD|nr:helix-turn-helix transcriptional regulator [Mycobacterium nebraskense]MBI2693030.1 helix-turn-helix transcriptional regulator [Mycobacterium nebraskense]